MRKSNRVVQAIALAVVIGAASQACATLYTISAPNTESGWSLYYDNSLVDNNNNSLVGAIGLTPSPGTAIHARVHGH